MGRAGEGERSGVCVCEHESEQSEWANKQTRVRPSTFDARVGPNIVVWGGVYVQGLDVQS